MPTPYRIETERLVIRPWSLDQAAIAAEIVAANSTHLGRFLPWAREAQDADGYYQLFRRFRASYDRDEDYVLAIHDRGGTPIGGTGYHLRVGPDAAELGYWIAKSHEGRGYVTEAVSALTRVGIEVMQLHRIEIRCDPANTRSAAIPLRLGFRDEGTLRARTVDDGRYGDSRIFTLLAPELPASPAASVEVTAWDGAGRRLL